MSDVPKLRECPGKHEGQMPKMVHEYPLGHSLEHRVAVRCVLCGWIGPYKDNDAEAIAAWNNRPDPLAELRGWLNGATSQIEGAVRVSDLPGEKEILLAQISSFNIVKKWLEVESRQ